MKIALIISLLFLSACSIFRPDPETHPSGLQVTEIKPNRDSHFMKQNLLQLAQVYDLSPFLFTKIVQIKTDAISQSHPVLTLNTRYTNYPHKILASFLHEEFHWWAEIKKAEMTLATTELRKIFPRQTLQIRQHMIISYLEYQAVKYYLGEKSARLVFQDFIRKEKLRPWIYSQVLVNGHVFKRILLKNKLIPSPLS